MLKLNLLDAKIYLKIWIPGIVDLLLLFYSTTLKKNFIALCLGWLVDWSYRDQATHAVYTGTEIYTNKCKDNQVCVGCICRQNRYFIKYYAILGSVFMENDYHSCENAATSKYYTKLILVVIWNDYHFCENSNYSKYHAILIPVIEKWPPFLWQFWYLSEYLNYSRYQTRKSN